MHRAFDLALSLVPVFAGAFLSSSHSVSSRLVSSAASLRLGALRVRPKPDASVSHPFLQLPFPPRVARSSGRLDAPERRRSSPATSADAAERDSHSHQGDREGLVELVHELVADSVLR